jgi:hypothetical protein
MFPKSGDWHFLLLSFFLLPFLNITYHIFRSPCCAHTIFALDKSFKFMISLLHIWGMFISISVPSLQLKPAFLQQWIIVLGFTKFQAVVNIHIAWRIFSLTSWSVSTYDTALFTVLLSWCSVSYPSQFPANGWWNLQEKTSF